MRLDYLVIDITFSTIAKFRVSQIISYLPLIHLLYFVLGLKLEEKMTAMISPKANSLAIERMREMDEQERLERICTKQKRGTPIVSSLFPSRNFSHYKKLFRPLTVRANSVP